MRRNRVAALQRHQRRNVMSKNITSSGPKKGQGNGSLPARNCKVCNMHLSVSAGKLNLDRHMTMVKHEANCKKLVQQPTILQATSTRESLSDKLAKKGEIQMAIFIAEHNLPIAVANHLPKFIQQV